MRRVKRFEARQLFIQKYFFFIAYSSLDKKPFYFYPFILYALALVGTHFFISALCFVSFSFIASAIYILNDWIDRKADSLHPLKASRPLAAGKISGQYAAFTAMLCLAIGFFIALFLNKYVLVLVLILLYLLNNLIYNFYFRTKDLLDIFSISIGFVIRVLIGAVALNIEPSSWLLTCTGLVSLFMAAEKRRDDLNRYTDVSSRPSLSGYTHEFLMAVSIILLGCLASFYLIYVTDHTIQLKFKTPYLPITSLFVLFGVLRYLQLSLVYTRSGSPLDIIISDRPLKISVLCWLIFFMIVFLTH